jgi:hypothetical protein
MPFGIYWSMLMGGAAAVSYWRNPNQPYYWDKMILTAIAGYAIILLIVFCFQLIRKHHK